MNQLLPQHDSFFSAPANHPQKDADDIMAMLEEYNKRDEIEDHQDPGADWCGFFTRNKQFKVEVEFRRIHKEPFELPEIALNVSYRANLTEGLERGDFAFAGKFRATNQANV